MFFFKQFGFPTEARLPTPIMGKPGVVWPGVFSHCGVGADVGTVKKHGLFGLWSHFMILFRDGIQHRKFRYGKVLVIQSRVADFFTFFKKRQPLALRSNMFVSSVFGFDSESDLQFILWNRFGNDEVFTTHGMAGLFWSLLLLGKHHVFLKGWKHIFRITSDSVKFLCKTSCCHRMVVILKAGKFKYVSLL